MKIKKQLATLSILLVMLVLAGCPAPDNSENPLENETRSDLGSVLVSGDFSENKFGKSLDLNEVVGLFKANITEVRFEFNNIVSEERTLFYVEVLNGRFREELFLISGQYKVYIEARDNNRSTLFFAYEELTILSGESQTLQVHFELASDYRYRFTFSDEHPLPGEYKNHGDAEVVDANGKYWYAWYQTEYSYDENDNEYVSLVFEAWLPLDFSGGALLVEDANGDTYAAQLDFNIFNAVGNIMVIDFVESDMFSELNVEFFFPTQFGIGDSGSGGGGVPCDGIVSYYKLDETYGDVIDSVGANSLSVTGAIRGSLGKIDTAYAFGPGADYATSSTSPVTGNEDYSAFAWVKTTSTGDRREILVFGKSTNRWNQTCFLYKGSDGKLHMDLSNVPGPVSALAIDTGDWMHVGVVNTGGSMQLYVNGSVSGSPQSMSPNLQNELMIIGCSWDFSNGFDGSIDEVGIWNLALTLEEIELLYLNESTSLECGTPPTGGGGGGSGVSTQG